MRVGRDDPLLLFGLIRQVSSDLGGEAIPLWTVFLVFVGVVLSFVCSMPGSIVGWSRKSS